jgi:ribosomal protein L11 methyltransferase
VKTYIPEDDAAARVQEEIEQALWHLGQLRSIEPLAPRRIKEEDWANAWKPFFPVVHVGTRTVIVPAWRRYPRPREDELIVRLDPGLAFGTGTHPTTQLCLRWVERLVQPGNRVLDVGTGSGILAIAAVRAGAAEVVAVDIDPLAVDAARANVRLNRLSRRIKVRLGSAQDVQPDAATRYDVVLANVTARVNAELAPWLAGAVRIRGHVVASGILADSAETVVDAFRGSGLLVREREQEGDWVALVAERTESLSPDTASV